jgi:NAD(P)-dependent dehydrogenase (short-subunit alcohol dehydrogenase family)
MKTHKQQCRSRRLAGFAGFMAASAGIVILNRVLSPKFHLNGKVVLITGGSRGLGLVMAREFGERGARLAICARDQAELDRAASDLQNRGYTVQSLVCDVTDRKQVEETVAAVRARFGSIDVLVNNAGVISVGPLESMTEEDYRESLATHFWGPLYTMLAVLPDMRKKRAGRIVNISSIGGTVSVPHLVPYCAGKFALAGLSEGVHAEALKDNVCVTTVYPGLMRTGSPRNAFFKSKHRAEYAWFSISDALPLFSISAERAARTIVNACERGSARVVLSLPAKAAAAGFHLFPGSATLMGLVARMLPGEGGIGTERVAGKDSHSAVSPSFLTALNERAAVRNNEVA